MALRGLKPVVEIQFFDYIWPAFMQIRDELSMMRYRSGNHWSCPVVIRVPIGGYLRGGAPYHSQSGVRDLRAQPGHSDRAALERAGRRRSAAHGDPLRRPGALLRAQAPLSPDLQQSAVSRPRLHGAVRQGAVVREGTDIVVFTWGALVQRSLLAAQQAERRHQRRRHRPADDHSVRLGDDRRVHEEDEPGIVAHEDQLTCGFGAEIAARISEELFDYLDAPVKRVAALDCPVAYAPVLEEAILPGSADVLKAIKSLAAF